MTSKTIYLPGLNGVTLLFATTGIRLIRQYRSRLLLDTIYSKYELNSK